MTLSTSAVAVCCCSDSRSSLSSRVFSMAMTAWAAKFLTSSICLSVNGRPPGDRCDRADQLVVLEHRHSNVRARTAKFDERNARGSRFSVGLVGLTSAMWTDAASLPRCAQGQCPDRAERPVHAHIARRTRAVHRAARQAECVALAQHRDRRTWPRRCAWHSPAWPRTPAPARRAS